MKLLCVGLNWKTPIRIRERVAFEGLKLPRALSELKTLHQGREFAILSTCNRTELYAASTQPQGVDIDDLCEFLAHFQEISLSEIYDYLYFHEDAGAALHLFKVASGLDSLILGEAQILGQVKQAYEAATATQTVGTLLHTLFQRAFTVAKRVQNETALSKGKLSIASAAVDFVRGVFERFSDKTALVIGAGKMAELTLTHLAELKPQKVLICNRNRERAEQLAAKFHGEVRSFESLHESLIEADIIISSTGSDQPIVRADEFQQVMKARKQRWVAIVDIALPRDFETSIAEIENVMLWNIDDLEKVRNQTMRTREKELDRALKIVDGEVDLFQSSLAIKQSAPVIGRLEQEYQRILERELEWLLPQLNGIPVDQQEKIRHFAHRLKNKFLHPPKAALRAEAMNGKPHGLLDALRKLFALDD